jgi:formate-dependent nitrite reductase cytochrome c552 subunit
MFKQDLRPQHAEVARDRGNAARTNSSSKRSGLKRRMLFVGVGVLAVVGLGFGAIQISSGARSTGPTSRPAEVTNASKFAVVINRPPGPPQVATGQTNFHGQPVFASCVACHTTTKPNLESRRTEDLDQFHQGLKYNHGNLTCLSCHNSTDYDTLRLADTRSVEFSDSMTLCSQCHGPQRRDYDRGLHGGMNGHWDLTRGGRTRNTCINCHDPHTPKFPQVLPVLSPRDRVSVQKHISPDASH